MKLRTVPLAAVLLCAASSAALAAATPEGAGQIAKALQAYLTDTPGVVTVTANGDNYDTTIDFAPLFAKLPGKDVSIGISPLKLTINDQGAGKWKVDQDQPIAITFKAPGAADIDMKIDSVKGTGIFDEALGAFASTSTDLKGLAYKQAMNPEGQPASNAEYRIDSMHYESSNKADGEDAVAGQGAVTYNDIAETIGVPATGGSPAMTVNIAAAKGSSTFNYRGLKAKPISRLATFLVSHPSQELLIRDQAQLKDALKAALPVFGDFAVTGGAEDMKIQTPLGVFGIPRTSVEGNLTGIVKDARFREMISVEGLTTPPGVVPPFAADLVPSKLVLDFNAAGFDLASPAALMLDKADFSKTPPLPPDLEVELGKLALPTGTFTVGLGPSQLVNKLSELRAEGSMEINPAMADKAIPPAKADISLAGFDKLQAALQAFPPEMGMQQALPAMMLIKGFAKAAADGTLSWHIETTPTGATVNGVDLSKMMGGGQ